jgi:hypothetical protein
MVDGEHIGPCAFFEQVLDKALFIGRLEEAGQER